MASLFWLDGEWTKSHIEKIFPIENETLWRYTMTGYLFYSNKIDEDVYKTLRKYGDYEKAIATDFGNDVINEQVVDHICVGYLAGWEKLSNHHSLISQLIERENAEQLKIMGQFFWNVKTIGDLKSLWAKVHPIIIKNIENEDYKLVAAKFALLMGKVEKIDDDIYQWTKKYLPYVGMDYNVPSFVEGLERHVEKAPEYVSKLLLGLLENGIFPDYKEKWIRHIVEVAYKNDYKTIADSICNLYAENGRLFLRDIYEKCNNSGESSI